MSFGEDITRYCLAVKPASSSVGDSLLWATTLSLRAGETLGQLSSRSEYALEEERERIATVSAARVTTGLREFREFDES